MNSKLSGNLQFGTQKLISYGIWLMVLILGFSTIQNAGKVIQTRTEIQKEKEKVEKMRQQNEELERRVVEAQSVSFIEKQVRDKLGLAKAGEAIVILPEGEILRKLAPQTGGEEDSLPDPNWKKWEKLFF